jgi:membrane-bound lytic murein transglycosylase D
MPYVRLLVLLSLSSAALPAFAAGDRQGGVFPPRKQKAAPVEEAAPAADPPPVVVDEGEGPPDPNAPAVEPPPPAEVAPDAPAAEPTGAEGIWDWVDRMEGEIPSPEQVQAIREVTEEQSSERALIDDLSGAPPPVRFYEDPRAALTVDPLYLDLVDQREFDIPIDKNPMVEKWIRYFTGSGRKYYTKWLARSTRYQPMMHAALKEAGLPQDLVYLSMIESGYNTHAYSHADAAGLWQFIPSTGKLYDLRIDWWVDERRDPEMALHAAIAFLGELHGMFGDWRLAWAAYNGGPGRVRRAIAHTGTKDFWAIAAGTSLHPETDNYVPKIMAAAIIAKHPERYGFTGIEYEDELVYETQHVEGAVELEVLARCADTSLDELQELNPAIRRYATPAEGYDVRMPIGRGSQFVAALDAVPQSERMTVVRHTVRRGETLSNIAAKYGTTVSDVSRANNLRNVNRIYVGMNLVIPRTGSAPPAAREDVTLASVRPDAATTPKPAATTKKPTTHTVVRGDALSDIARRYGVSAGDLQRWNHISDASHIEVGQRLSVSGTAAASSSGSGWTTYVVRRGDSLGAIADRHDCTVSELKSWNSLRTTVIQPGQKLRISKG